MPVIHEKFVFTHIQKTAGTSLKMMFQDSYPQTLCVTYPHHVPLRDLDPEIYQNKFKFTIVRNPFARQYSYYQNDCRAKKEDGRKVMESFEEYFYFRHNDPKFYQEYFLCDINEFDKVYKTEQFDDMIEDLESRFGFKFKRKFYYGKQHIFNRDYSEHYSRRMIKILMERERTLTEHFDYKF